MSSLPLLGNGFQRRTFRFLWVLELSPPSPTRFYEQQLAILNPNNLLTATQVKVKSKSKLCYNRWPVSQSVLVSRPHLGPKVRFLLPSDSCGFVDVGRPLSRRDKSSPAQSFWSPSPAGLMTIFFRLRFHSSLTWRARSPYLNSPSNRVAQLYPQALCSLFFAPFGSQATMEVSEPASTRG
jgi:hypothetical protein